MKTKDTKGPLQTRWAKEVLPANALPKYPRPQMVRNDWLNLNGLWEYEITDANEKQPEVFSAKILVPYPIESSLSGVRKQLKPQERLWYKRHFIIPKRWTGKRILLHFGAVDWQATVYVNGHNLGTHQGGYDAFTFDITDVLKPDGSQAVVVKVYDPKAMQVAKEHYLKDLEGVCYCENKYDALDNSDGLILITEWPEFRSPDFAMIKNKLKTPIIFDGRNQYNVEELEQIGFEYYQIGKSNK